MTLRGGAWPWRRSTGDQNLKFTPTYTDRPMPGTAVPHCG
jgi:hypothetical protein